MQTLNLRNANYSCYCLEANYWLDVFFRGAHTWHSILPVFSGRGGTSTGNGQSTKAQTTGTQQANLLSSSPKSLLGILYEIISCMCLTLQTIDQREKKQQYKAKRKAILKARLAKVKQRKLLRAGVDPKDLPPGMLKL